MPAQFFEGVVLLGDTNKPAANVRIQIWASQQTFGGSMISVEGKTNEEGRFRLNPYPGVRFGILAYPPQGSPYQMRQLGDSKWSSGESSKNIELRLAAGMLRKEPSVDAKSGKPLARVPFNITQIKFTTSISPTTSLRAGKAFSKPTTRASSRFLSCQVPERCSFTPPPA